MSSRASQAARAGLVALTATSGLAMVSTSPASATPAPACTSLGTITADATCILQDGEQLQFTLKGGNGGAGGSGGDAGRGGDGWDGTDPVAGGLGGRGGRGAIGGAGAKIHGSYTNTSGHAVTVDVAQGADGSPGVAGWDGVPGADATPPILNVGADGSDGQSGTDGADGTAATITVDATLVAAAGGGTGGQGGSGGVGGEGGAGVTGGEGRDGFDGSDGMPGTGGVSTPSPLPSGWTALSTSWTEAPAISVTAALPAAVTHFVPLTPTRLLDTRGGAALVGQAPALEIDVAGHAGVPADASAVVFNVTATGSSSDGYVTLYPCGASVPTTSTVNFAPGQTVANAATVPLSDGKVCAFAYTDTNLVLDVNGAYSPAAGAGLLTPVTPARALDTRGDGKVQPGVVKTIAVAGRYGVAADATAVVLNLTAVRPEADGYVTVYPCGSAVPGTSNLNFVAGQTVPNQVTVHVGDGGAVCAVTTAATHLIVDVDAAFSAAGAALYQTVTPARLLDTRRGARLTAGVPLELTVGGQAGVDADAVAVVLNVTVTQPARAGYVTVYPCGSAAPLASNLNVSAHQTVANAVTVGLTEGKACIVSTTTTELVVDVNGQYLAVAPS